MNTNAIRFSPRIDFKMPIQFKSVTRPTDQSHEGVTCNMSAQGMYFVTKERHTVGEQIKVQLEIPWKLTGNPPTAYLYVGIILRVLRVDEQNENYGIGLRFLYYRNVDSESIGPWVAPIRIRQTRKLFEEDPNDIVIEPEEKFKSEKSQV